jgi:threonine aldolase
MNEKISFASDNYAPIHPDVLAAITRVNQGFMPSYGNDSVTAETIARLAQTFGQADAAVFFVTTGTAANTLCLQTMVKPYGAIICTELAHINVHETGAPERWIGCKVIDVPHVNGKLTVEAIANQLHTRGDTHCSQPQAIVLSQLTEVGTVYSLHELKTLTDFAHQNELYVYMDGARLANAAVTLDCSLAAMTQAVGIDAVTFGGAKNGILVGEAIVFLNQELARHFEFMHKQGLQLLSKMRYIAVQFAALLDNELWRQNARHANDLAQRLAQGLKARGLQTAYPVQGNEIFITLSHTMIEALQAQFLFYVFDPTKNLVRLVTSFANNEQEVDAFLAAVDSCL